MDVYRLVDAELRSVSPHPAALEYAEKKREEPSSKSDLDLLGHFYHRRRIICPKRTRALRCLCALPPDPSTYRY